MTVLVAQVQMPVTSPLQCPISLETPPQCPQITPCGHVFGFVPIMGYLLSHGGPALRKACPCPLCFVPIAARELRLLRTQAIRAPQVRHWSNHTLVCMQECQGMARRGC